MFKGLRVVLLLVALMVTAWVCYGFMSRPNGRSMLLNLPLIAGHMALCTVELIGLMVVLALIIRKPMVKIENWWEAVKLRRERQNRPE